MNKPYGRIKIQENGDGRKMLGGGCETCPVVACATSTYRGSACASQRASHGLGDPMTNADYIRSMTDEELATMLRRGFCGFVQTTGDSYCKESLTCDGCVDKWLKQPKENTDE